jgi:4-amino-4-deoxy-L-arabinose transferase-like glycosyltransferase
MGPLFQRRLAVAAECLSALLLCAFGLSMRVTLFRSHWAFAGSDSYGYINIADEWRRHGRFAFASLPSPLEWYRRPLYPIFISLVKGDAPIKQEWCAGLARVIAAQIICEAVFLWPLIYFTARRIAGALAGLLALGFATAFIPAVLYSGAILTEPLAMIFAAFAVAPLVWRSQSSTAAWAIAAIGAAFSSLLRPDGILWLAATVPAFFDKETKRAQRRRGVLVYALLFAGIVSPWVARNIYTFGHHHLFDGMIDRSGNDIPNYRGFWNWTRTWSSGTEAAGFPASCFYDQACPDLKMELYEKLGAFDAPATTSALEQAAVSVALGERVRDGITPRVSTLFDEIAEQRARAHPFRVYVQLPVLRALRAWLGPQSELRRNVHAWPSLALWFVFDFPLLSSFLFWATISGAAVLLSVVRTRRYGLILIAGLFARTAALGWTGFSLARYVVPAYPICFILIGAGAGALINWCLMSSWRALGYLRRRGATATTP